MTTDFVMLDYEVNGQEIPSRNFNSFQVPTTFTNTDLTGPEEAHFPPREPPLHNLTLHPKPKRPADPPSQEP